MKFILIKPENISGFFIYTQQGLDNIDPERFNPFYRPLNFFIKIGVIAFCYQSITQVLHKQVKI